MYFLDITGEYCNYEDSFLFCFNNCTNLHLYNVCNRLMYNSALLYFGGPMEEKHLTPEIMDDQLCL